jgi:hypothetical protein
LEEHREPGLKKQKWQHRKLTAASAAVAVAAASAAVAVAAATAAEVSAAAVAVASAVEGAAGAAAAATEVQQQQSETKDGQPAGEGCYQAAPGPVPIYGHRETFPDRLDRRWESKI